jgi:hypothetical protein
MQGRIWVEINGLQLHSLAPGRQDSGEDKIAWASLKLGSAFNIDGILITSGVLDAPEFSIGWGNANARLMDVQALHEKPAKGNLLYEVIAKAVHDFCLQRAEILHPFIKKAIEGERLTLGFFKPPDWQGKSLRIPVDFIRIRSFQRVNYGNIVTADIQIGHHLIFWSVKIWDSRLDWHPLTGFHDAPCGEERIQEKELNRLINRIFLWSDVREVATSVAKGTIDMESEFIDKVKGCDPEATPPPIKFE